MSKQAKKGCVPVLRFPEFWEAGEWEEKQLGNVCSSISSGKDKIDSNGNFDLYGSTGIIGKTSNDSYDGNFILVARVGANAGLLTRANGIFGVTDNTLVIVLKKSEKIDFIYYSLDRFGLNKMVFGSGQPLITGGQLKSLVVSFPSPEEQQKIAACLSSLDELITAQAQKVEALKTHKKGLMQQLFPAEGETVPKLRFPEFRDAGEWKNELLDNLAIRGSGHTPNKKYSNYYSGGIKWVSLADSKRLDKGEIFETEIEISEEGLKNSSAVLHPKGSVLLSRDAGVGKSAVMASPMAVSQHFIVWIPKDGVLLNWFLYYILQIKKKEFEEIAIGSTVKTIGLPYFKKLTIFIPSLKEQQKIAACLSSLDELITAQTQKLNALKTHKKGLMQQLFPTVDEVNA